MAWRWLCCFTFLKTAQRCSYFPVFGQLGCVTLYLFVLLVDYSQQGCAVCYQISNIYFVLNSNSACSLSCCESFFYLFKLLCCWPETLASVFSVNFVKKLQEGCQLFVIRFHSLGFCSIFLFYLLHLQQNRSPLCIFLAVGKFHLLPCFASLLLFSL